MLEETAVRFTNTVNLSAISIVRRQGFRRHISIRAPKYPLATLIQGVAAAVLHHLLEQAPDCSYSVHQNIEFSELSLRQLLPAI